MCPDPILELDQLIHAPVRLAILSLLANLKDADFVFLRDATETTDGNLSTHISKLEGAGYVRVSKTFVGKKPQTKCAITAKGRRAFIAYLRQLDAIVQGHKRP